MHDSDLHVRGALALELVPGSAARRDTLPQRQAGALAALIARDLAAQHADAASLQLVTVAAHYDPVELLRPGWPLHRELEQLATHAPRNPSMPDTGGRIIALGSHDGNLPAVLTPSPDFAGGPLRLLPFLLGTPMSSADAVIATRVRDAFETNLLEHGMAAADTALAAQDAFGLRIEHARYLTLHDLAAMTALQYEHAGLAALWPLLETALLQPGGEQWLDAPPEPLLHYRDGEARIALFDPQAWRARYAAASSDDHDRLQRDYAQFEARQRQFAAMLGAHGVPVTFVYCDGGIALEQL